MRLILLFLMLLGVQASAHAYIGPGLGAGAIGVILGIIGSVFLAIFAIFWYPIKRLIKKSRARKKAETEKRDTVQEPSPDQSQSDAEPPR